MKRTKAITKRLYIHELECPLPADSYGEVTTQAVGEETLLGKVTTMAVGEEAK